MPENNNENPIIKKNDALVSQDEQAVESVYGKVMRVTSETEGVDVNGIFAKLMQYANMTDALASAEKTVEYVVLMV